MFDKLAIDNELKKLGALTPRGYFVALHIYYTCPAMLFQTLNREWIDHYTDNGYLGRDPVITWAFRTIGATRWSNRKLLDPAGVFKKAAEFGLKYGATISLGETRSKTVASVARDDREYSDSEISEVQSIIHRLHDLTEPSKTLTPSKALTDAQIEALKYIADGYRLAEAADTIGISESGLKARLRAVRRNLKARTTAAAIQLAKDHKLI